MQLPLPRWPLSRRQGTRCYRRGRMRLKERLSDPATWLHLGFLVAVIVGCNWALPGPDTWANDSISPRSCGLGAIVETYRTGHRHHYPPLHMAVLTVVSLPWMAIAASRVGIDIDKLGPELLKPFYMTGIEAGARVVAAAMAIGIVYQTMRLWERLAGRRAGVAAGVVVTANAPLVYYAHTGNLDVPFLFWVSWALVEIDRVASGEPREEIALLLAIAAVLTKDPAACALIVALPIYLLVIPKVVRGTPVLRRGVVRGTALGVVAYAVVSGAAVNPTGFALRLKYEIFVATETAIQYPLGWRGTAAIARDAFLSTDRFTSWPVAATAAVGLIMVIAQRRGLDRARALLPFVAAASFSLIFNLLARQTLERYLLPQSLLYFPYAAIPFDWAWTRWARARVALAAAMAVALSPAWLGVASLDATLLADPRYEAEHFLAALPRGTRVEVYGGPHFVPRIPPNVAAVRPGVEPLEDRQPIYRVADMVDPAMDPRPRAPDVILLATELSTVPEEYTGPPEYGLTGYRDAISNRFFQRLYDGSFGFVRSATFTCSLPWPLACRSIHSSTAGQVWVYTPAR